MRNAAQVGKPENYEEMLENAVSELLTACLGCRGYFDYMKERDFDLAPAQEWLDRLDNAIEKGRVRQIYLN